MNATGYASKACIAGDQQSISSPINVELDSEDSDIGRWLFFAGPPKRP